jgi:hypothetical protein
MTNRVGSEKREYEKQSHDDTPIAAADTKAKERDKPEFVQKEPTFLSRHNILLRIHVLNLQYSIKIYQSRLL